MSYIYLANPYSDPSPAVRNQRFQAALAATAKLKKLGLVVFSPIVHSHLVAQELDRLDDKPIDIASTCWDFWKRDDEVFIQHCSEVWVLMLEGWHRSVGVNAEMELAHQYRKPVKFYNTELIHIGMEGA
jgi:DNA-binding transcriptional regulator PaaX